MEDIVVFFIDLRLVFFIDLEVLILKIHVYFSEVEMRKSLLKRNNI